MRVQTIGRTGFVYLATRTSMNDIAKPAGQMKTALGEAVSSGVLRPTGPMLFIYHDPSEDPAKPFDLEIGFPTDSENAPPGQFKFRRLTPFRCATVIYRGPMKDIGQAYDRLIPQIIAARHVPSDQTRENYLSWKGPDSPNNVVQIEVGIH
ncbi:MAG TPA: GyrI-like domain-containing protein [Tepidisphaeraceae bacterium]|nr:GyrI-like domain-containing protein [Tepidisphaeraceae bacterium]